MDNLNKQLNLIEIHQKRLPLLNNVIEGYLALVKLIDLELSNSDWENTMSNEKLREIRKESEQFIEYCSKEFGKSEDVLKSYGIEPEYPETMTREQWISKEGWYQQFVYPYLCREHWIVSLFRSVFRRAIKKGNFNKLPL